MRSSVDTACSGSSEEIKILLWQLNSTIYAMNLWLFLI